MLKHLFVFVFILLASSAEVFPTEEVVPTNENFLTESPTEELDCKFWNT